MAEDYSVRAVLSAYDRGFSSAMQAAAKQTGALDRSMGGALKTGGAMAIGMKGVDMAIGAIKNHIGAAVDRFDTIQKFPKVMEQLGFSAQDASNVMKNKLSPAIDGLPTAMDEVVKSTQQIALITGDLDGAADTATALNDAFLASGSSAWDASRGLTQYTQMLTTGRVDMQSWRTLLETMGPALNRVAKEFGYTGASAKNDLYQALKDGTITFDEFNRKIIELDHGVNGFAEQARTQSTGIRTSFTNIGTAVTKGIANAITEIEKLSKKSGLGGIAENADRVKAVVNAAFDSINETISKIDLKGVAEAASPYWNMFSSVVKTAASAVMGLATVLGQHAGLIAKVTPLVLGLMGAYKGYSAVTSAAKSIRDCTNILRGVPTVVEEGTLAMKLQQKTMAATATSSKAISTVKGKLDMVKTAWNESTIAINRQKAATQTVTALYGKNAAGIYAVGTATSRTTGLTKAFTVVQRALNRVLAMGPWKLLAIGLALATAAFAIFMASNDKAREKVKETAKNIATGVKAFAAKIPDIVKTVSEMIPQIADFLANEMPEMIAAGSDALIAFIDGFSSSLPTLIEAGTNVLLNLIDSFTANMPKLIQTGLTVVQSLIDGIVTNMPKIIESAVNMITAFITGLASCSGKIVGAALMLIGALTIGIIKSIPVIIAAAPKIVAALKNAVIATGRALLAAGRTLINRIKSGIKSGLKGLAAIGGQVVSGLWNGIGNKVSWLKNKIKGFVGNVKSWLKKFFKIGSPSKLMAKEIGQYLPMGIAKGFDSKASVVMQSVKDLGWQMTRATLPTPAFAGGLSDEYSYGATIEVPLYVNGREFARATGAQMQSELNTRQLMNNRLAGRL